MSSPAPNVAGYVALAAFAALAIYALTASPSTPPPTPPSPKLPPRTFTWIDVMKSGQIVPGLGAVWTDDGTFSQHFPGATQPDYYSVDDHSWHVEGGRQLLDTNALVVNREEV